MADTTESSSEMIDVQQTYTINISNMKAGQTIYYPLPLIKGQVHCSDKQPVNGTITVQLDDKTSQFPVFNSQFKILVELKKDSYNEIKLTYETTDTIFKLKYVQVPRRFIVIPVYIVSHDHDGRFQGPEGTDCSIESAMKRINLGAKLLQMIIAEKLNDLDLCRRTFLLQECRLFTSALSVRKARKTAADKLYEFYGRELFTRFLNLQNITIPRTHIKFLAFLACTKYEAPLNCTGMMHEDVVAHTKGHVALGGGGLALFGTGCLHTWPLTVDQVLPCLQCPTKVDKSKLMDHSSYRGTYGGCYATTLGAVLHELCHTFDLGHTATGIMGRGFDHMDLVFGEEEEDKSWQAGIHSAVVFNVNLHVKYGMQQSKIEPGASAFDSFTPNCRRLTDRTFFTKSCGYLLAYNNWTVRSKAGVRVVEIRTGDEEMVRIFWCFEQPRQVFVVPRSKLPSKLTLPVKLVARDTCGNTLRHKFSAEQLTNL